MTTPPSRLLSFYRQIFMEAAPYLLRYHGSPFVFWLSPELQEGRRDAVLEDLFILRLLGIPVVLFVGGEPDPPHPLSEGEEFQRIAARELNRLWEVIQRLSRAFLGIPERRYRARITTGNYLTLRRKGILQGRDWGSCGEFRSLDRERLQELLNLGEIVVFSGILPGATGELLWASPLELARECAVRLSAEKLVFLLPELRLDFPGEWGEQKLREFLEKNPSDPLLREAQRALEQGVPRIHFIPGEPGGVLKELLSLEGYGVLFTRHPSTQLVPARTEEIEELSALLHLFEGDGSITPRTRERIEAELEHYRILKADNRIVACGALHIHREDPPFAFFEAIAVHPQFQGKGLGGAILSGLEAEARREGARSAYLYTTKAHDWFLARGYQPLKVEEAPPPVRLFFQRERNSTLLYKSLATRERIGIL